MKKIVIMASIWLGSSLLSKAQSIDETFAKLPNWKAVLDSASRANKNIFVDFYATWCEPCKVMDQKVYSDSKVVEDLRRNFFAVKVQIDKTKADSKEVQSWYKDAANLASRFNVNAFPTFLFLSPRGELIRMETGYLDATEFSNLLKSASNPEEAYYLQLKAYQDGKIPVNMFLPLAIKAKKYSDDSLANQIVHKYKSKWFDKQSYEKQLKSGFVDLVTYFPSTVRETDKVVRYMAEHTGILDSLNRPNISEEYIRYFVSRDIIDPIITKAESKGKEPNWNDIELIVSKKYTLEQARQITFDNKLAWHYKKQNWSKVIEYEIEKIEKVGLQKSIKNSGSTINNLVFDIIFKKSNDTSLLLKGADYMKELLKTDPDRHTWNDTYANILYKLGRKSEAIVFEKKAISLAKSKQSIKDQKEYENVLKLMENNEPTWY